MTTRYRFGNMEPNRITVILQYITKLCPCNVYPLEPHFYITKLGYVGVYLFFLFLLQNIDCGYSLELPRRGGSNVYPQTMFWAKIRKNLNFFHRNFQFLLVKKISVYCMCKFSYVIVLFQIHQRTIVIVSCSKAHPPR